MTIKNKMNIKRHKNIKNDSFIKKPQPDYIYFNEKLCRKKTMSEIDDCLGYSVFFQISQWLAQQKNFNTVYLYGKVTDIKEKALQINFSTWFPKSQITNIYKYVGMKNQQMLLKDWGEFNDE